MGRKSERHRAGGADVIRRPQYRVAQFWGRTMLRLLWLIPALPLFGFLILALIPLPRKAVPAVGVGSIGVSALISILVTTTFLNSPPSGHAFTQILWNWIDVPGFRPSIGLYLDALSLLMVLVVTFVSFWIHLYSVEFMIDDEGYSRFFAYMNLFVASMITLLLGDNLLLLYLGWEGVGLCSYLLIGFWYQEPVNGRAARKAFIVTRVGDAAMALGLFLLFQQLGSLQIEEAMSRASDRWAGGSPYAIAAAFLLLGGAVGKSAQLPLQTWLPDAMAGPTPTSALIHAATMVTAGVYLIARTHVLFALAPPAQFAVAVIGIATLLMAGFSALTQSDIKRVLAYSTMSQIGYMFLALGVGAWSAAIFHFMTHAFFKALLFLAAGAVIQALQHEHNIFRMGGLRRELPLAYWSFLIGGSALAGLPVITSGFYSKDLIIWSASSPPNGGMTLWALAIAGVFLTSLYTYRLIFLVFFGRPVTHAGQRPGLAMTLPLVVLSTLALVGGLVETPAWLGTLTYFSDFMNTALPSKAESSAGLGQGVSAAFASLAFILGWMAAWMLYLRSRALVDALSASAIGTALRRLWYSDWGFDWLYDRVFVRPILWFARINHHDVVDAIYTGLARLSELAYRALRPTETGRVRWYAAGIVAGSVVYFAIVLLG